MTDDITGFFTVLGNEVDMWYLTVSLLISNDDSKKYKYINYCGTFKCSSFLGLKVNKSKYMYLRLICLFIVLETSEVQIKTLLAN